MEECHLLLTDQIDLINPEANRVVHDMSKPLPLGGPPRQVTIQAQYFFNKDLEYLVSVRSHMKILSVVSLKTFSKYGYTFLKDIVLRRADYKEYKISEADFKNMYPNDFEDMYLLNLQGKLNHLSGADKLHLSTALNITQPRWDATDFLFKGDYTIVQKPRAVIYRDRNNQKKMMRETKVHKFSDDTLRRILEKLDYMYKDYELYKCNPGMENRIWNEDDKRRSQEFIKLIERRLKIRRIFRSLESFVSGRITDIDYRLIDRT
ncbi:hypothetical protein Tco_0167811 [Tanacetum coccineum]